MSTGDTIEYKPSDEVKGKINELLEEPEQKKLRHLLCALLEFDVTVPDRLGKSIADADTTKGQLIINRYNNLSMHIKDLALAGQNLFKFYIAVIIPLFSLQILAIGARDTESFKLEPETAYIVNYSLFAFHALLIFMLSLQILFVLHEWKVFRTRQKYIYDLCVIKDGNLAMTSPNILNWSFEIGYVAIFFASLFLSGSLVEVAQRHVQNVELEDFERALRIDCNAIIVDGKVSTDDKKLQELCLPESGDETFVVTDTVREKPVYKSRQDAALSQVNQTALRKEVFGDVFFISSNSGNWKNIYLIVLFLSLLVASIALTKAFWEELGKKSVLIRLIPIGGCLILMLTVII